MLWFLLTALAADPSIVQGMTISTPTYGPEWDSPAMRQTLRELRNDGANWVSYHPYARISKTGRVSVRWRPEQPPDWVTRPVGDAHEAGLKVMVKPHLAYWGAFEWRGAIQFDDPEERARFFADYTRWIVAIAKATPEADAFVVGTELDGLRDCEAEWRAVIAAVRAVYGGHLTFAANWDTYASIPFWDALDAIGVQAYFPLVHHTNTPTDAELRAGWTPHLAQLKQVARATGKPVVFTELGYDAHAAAAREPWSSGRGDPALQARLVRVALETIANDPVITGAFLWKWFPGERQVGDFRMSSPAIRRELQQAWRPVKPAE